MKKLFLIPVLLLALWGCSSKTKVEDEQTTSFIVGIITASTTQEAGMSQVSTLKRGKVINLKTCIKDYVYLSNIKEETFVINGGKKPYSAKTNHLGCLTWSEEVNIDDLKSMGAVMTERTIVGTGSYKGSVTVPLAFRLLASGSAAVIDDRYKDVPMTDAAKKQRDDGVSFILGEINISPNVSFMEQEQLLKAYRHVRLQVSVTIMNTEGQGIANHPFKIALLDETELVEHIDWDSIEKVHSASTSGQHVTSAMLTYKRFAAEYYMKKYVVVKSLEAPFKDVIQKREVYINPWQWWGRFFFWDTKWDVPGQLPQYRKIEKRQPQILVQELFLSYTGNDENSYNVNKYMDLTFKKNYQIKFRPVLNRKVSYVPGQDLMLYEIMWFGVLKAKMVLIRPKDGVLDLKKLSERGIKGLEDYEYVTGEEKILEVNENIAQGNFSFEFDFRQTPFMVTRSLLLIEISPADPEWEVEPVVVTVTMKPGEFWITEGALFATELFTDGNDEGIGIFKDNMRNENSTDGSIPMVSTGHPDVGKNAVTAFNEKEAQNYMEIADDNKAIGRTLNEVTGDPNDQRYIFMEREGAQDGHDEVTRIPEHLQIRDRSTYWKYDPLENFIKIYEETAEIEGFKFHHRNQTELNNHMRFKYDLAYEKFSRMNYSSDEERTEIERAVGMKGLYNLSTKRKVFDSFLGDPKGIGFSQYMKKERKKFQIFEAFKRLFTGKEIEYFGGSEQFENDYTETVTSLIRLFYHSDFYPMAFHVFNADNPLDYFKITPLTFLTETPEKKALYDGEIPESNTRKILAGRDTMPVSLAMVDVYTQKHSTSHTISGGLRISAKDLVTGGLSNVSRMSATAVGGVGTVVGSFSGSHSRSRTWFDEMGQKKDALLSSQFTLLIDQLLLEFDADNSQSCLLIEARDPEGSGSDSLFYSATDRDAYLVCYKDKNSEQTFKEMWYFINTANTDSTHFVDHNNLANRPIVMPLRGLRNFVEFRNSLVQRAEHFIVMKKDEYEPLARRALKDLFNISIDEIPEFLSDGEFPGAVPSDYARELQELELDTKTKLGIFGEDL